jgi:hypothetical protein
MIRPPSRVKIRTPVCSAVGFHPGQEFKRIEKKQKAAES